MKTVRLAAGLGFYGDAWAPVRAAIERGQVQYVCSDHLAELTLAILQKDRQRDPCTGYARDLVPMLAELWPLAAARGVRFVLNAGGLHPEGARQALVQLFEQKGWRARIAVVTGDAVLDRLDTLREAGESLAHLDTGAPIDTVRSALVFANVYLGARPVAQALAQGADIVITGRVADAALFLAPLLHEFAWGEHELDKLAQGVVAGHLLECSGQGSGGNFGSAGAWQHIPDLAHIGYPIAEVSEDGGLCITKAPDTGGRVDFHTVRQQLLYEVHNPHRYVTPDVVLDMGHLQLIEEGPNRVRVRGARGHAAPQSLKLVAGYRKGWMGQAVVGLSWPDALSKARHVAQTVQQQMRDKNWPIEEVCVEYLGHNTFLGPHATAVDEDALNEVWLRMAIRTPEQRVADGFGRLFPWLALSGPPYMGGFHGLQPGSQLLGLWPSTVRRSAVEPQVQVDVRAVR
jgi:Acyclic terpene utilisation family protein AtuA